MGHTQEISKSTEHPCRQFGHRIDSRCIERVGALGAVEGQSSPMTPPRRDEGRIHGILDIYGIHSRGGLMGIVIITAGKGAQGTQGIDDNASKQTLLKSVVLQVASQRVRNIGRDDNRTVS